MMLHACPTGSRRRSTSRKLRSCRATRRRLRTCRRRRRARTASALVWLRTCPAELDSNIEPWLPDYVPAPSSPPAKEDEAARARDPAGSRWSFAPFVRDGGAPGARGGASVSAALCAGRPRWMHAKAGPWLGILPRAREELAAGLAAAERAAAAAVTVAKPSEPPLALAASAAIDDVAVHIRAGDACGTGAPKRGQRMRRCSATPLQDAFALMNAHQLRGHVFLATDSEEIARASEAIGAEHGFKVWTLPIDRKQHESLCLSTVSRKDEPRCGTEFVARTRVRDLNMLTDTLLDSLLVRCPLPLASPCVPAHAYRAHDRASLPFPAVTFDGARRRNDVKLPPSRSAAARPNADRRACSCSSLATRRTPHFRTPCTPAEVCAWGGACAQVHRYIPLDGRKWCTRSSCRMNYTDTFHTA